MGAGALHRIEREFDVDGLRPFFAEKRVLITGAAGSIGSALALELARLGCAQLTLLDQFDHGLIEVLERVQRSAPRQAVADVLCDIRDASRLEACMRKSAPDIVFHAAALKHVHLGERHPGECLITNLVGVRNALKAAVNAGAEHFLLISSDKAAAPTCVMGATKRLAELHLLGFEAEQPGAAQIKCVRFGNVLGSQGSVLPRFKAQIEAGGPLEVTHPAMERFFMSPREAVGLILSVAAIEERAVGAYVMEMGDPVGIMDLGRGLIRDSGKAIKVEITGLRPGEKLKEQLTDADERVSATAALDGVFQVSPLSAEASVSSADVARLESMARTLDDAVISQRVFAFLDERLAREERSVG
jgi:O-antigen biosynthesis protein WbqV